MDDIYTIFMCFDTLSTELKQACEDKNITIVDGSAYKDRREIAINYVIGELVNHKIIFMIHAQDYITRKMNFSLMDSINYQIYRSSYGFLVMHEPNDNYYKPLSKRILADYRVRKLDSSDFINKSLDELIPNKQRVQDMERIEAIAPYFYSYNLQDLLPLLDSELQQIRTVEYQASRIYKWPVIFDESFYILTDNEKYCLLRKIEKKYHDFDEIINKNSIKMKDYYNYRKKSELYSSGIPHELELSGICFRDNNIRFKIILAVQGKNSIHYWDAGSFFVPWQC